MDYQVLSNLVIIGRLSTDEVYSNGFHTTWSRALKLAHIQGVVKALLGHQLVMGGHLHDLTAVDDHDPGGVADGG